MRFLVLLIYLLVLSSCASKDKLMSNSKAGNTVIGEVSVAGVRVKYEKSGAGMPSIVFLSGHRTPLSNWSEVVPGVVDMGTVLIYDRFDTGGSGQSTGPQDGDAILATLDSLLNEVNVNPPYIFVAHSLGGLYANLYVRRNPEKVAGLVMVEAAHPGEAHDQAAQHKPTNGLFSGLFKMFTPGFKKDPNSEFNNVSATIQQIENAPAFPEKFVAVITGGNKMPFVPAQAFKSHLQWQKELVSISPLGYQVMAEKSGHSPQISEPDLVVGAIANAIESFGSR